MSEFDMVWPHCAICKEVEPILSNLERVHTDCLSKLQPDLTATFALALVRIGGPCPDECPCCHALATTDEAGVKYLTHLDYCEKVRAEDFLGKEGK